METPHTQTRTHGNRETQKKTWENGIENNIQKKHRNAESTKRGEIENQKCRKDIKRRNATKPQQQGRTQFNGIRNKLNEPNSTEQKRGGRRQRR